jgi:transcriptional regulator with XRE-family HTH domain
VDEVAREPAQVLELRRALGRYLAACRQRAQWSQRKLADETHYHRTAISPLEAGRHPAPRDFWGKYGIALFDESFARDRQVYLTHLADALSRPGKQRDLDAAADRGLAAVRLAERLTSTRGIDCLRDLYPRMRPHAPVPAVRNFLERARAVLAA